MALQGGAIPYLDEGEEDWFSHFWRLSTDRDTGMGLSAYVGPIPEASIVSAQSDYPGEEDAFSGAVRAMDAAFLDHVRTKDDPKPQTASDVKAAFASLKGGKND